MEIELNDQNFDEEIKKAEKPILADFWASWCMPCNMLTPVLEKVAKSYEDKIILAKINLDEAKVTAQKLGIDRIPAVILFKEGKPVSGFIGVRGEKEISEWLGKMMGEENQKEETKEEKKEEENEEAGKEVQEAINWYEKYAEEKGFKLNPQRKVVEGLVKGLLENEKEHGARYCPCRRITGNFQEDRDKICPCVWHEGEIERDGHCYCHLFYKK